jgi:hypothetical protein
MSMEREVNKVGLEYDEMLMDGFWKWFNNPANKGSIEHKPRWSDTYYTRTKPEIVRAYIKTVPKKFVF